MTLVLAIIPVLLLIVLMAFFKMPGDKSSIFSDRNNADRPLQASLFLRTICSIPLYMMH